MNPGVSIAVYIEREKYCSNLCYLFIIIVAQVLGAIVAIGFGLILRVNQPVPGHEGEIYFVPSVTGFYPKLQTEANGLPCQGQILLAEIIGSTVFYLVYLMVKWEVEQKHMNHVLASASIAVTSYGVTSFFRHVSGGLFNPALAIMSVVWCSLTYQYDHDVNWSRWSVDLAFVYLVAPFMGAFLAGHLFNW